MPAVAVLLALPLALVACDLAAKTRQCETSPECPAGLLCIRGTCGTGEDAGGAGDGSTPTDGDAATADGEDGGDAEDAEDAEDVADGADVEDVADRTGDSAADGGDGGDPLDAALDRAPADAAAESASPPDAPPRVLPPTYPTTYLFTVTGDGRLAYSQFFIASVPWLVPPPPPTKSARDEIGDIGPIDDVEAHALGAEVNVMVRVGRKSYLASSRGEHWTPWRMVADDVAAMGLTNVGYDLWTCLATTGGGLYLGTRLSSGEWNLEDATADSRTLDGLPVGGWVRVDCAGIGDTLEIVAIDHQGKLWNAARRPDGWTRFHPVLTAKDLTLIDVDMVDSLGELHVLGSSATAQWDSAKVRDIWIAFSSLEVAVGFDPPGGVVAGSVTSLYSAEWLVELTSDSEIWFSARSINAITPYWRWGEAPPEIYKAVAAASVLP